VFFTLTLCPFFFDTPPVRRAPPRHCPSFVKACELRTSRACVFGMRLIAVVLLAAAIFVADARRHTVLTVAGQMGLRGGGGDGGKATRASLYNPTGIALHQGGNILIADQLNRRVRMVDGKTGIISTVACTGAYGFSGNGGLATNAECNTIQGVATDSVGNIYFGDADRHVIRKVEWSTRIITTFAGNGQTSGSGGDGGPATSAVVYGPIGLAVDRFNNLYIAENSGNRIRVVNATTGIISTVAGTGQPGFYGDGALATSAKLSGPMDVAVTARGEVFIADSGRVRKVDPVTGIISTVAGGNDTLPNAEDGLLAVNVHFAAGIHCIDVDPSGSPLYISSYTGVRMVNASGHISTILGTRTDANVDRISAWENNPPADPDWAQGFYDVIAVSRTGTFMLIFSSHTQHTVNAYFSESSLSLNNDTCNFTSMGQRDLVGKPLLHTSVTDEASCQAACCMRAGCEGYSYAPLPASAAYESVDRLQADFWHRISEEPSAWHTSCYLLANVTASVYSNAMKSGVLASLL
jgi:hypothetical protein